LLIDAGGILESTYIKKGKRTAYSTLLTAVKSCTAAARNNAVCSVKKITFAA